MNIIKQSENLTKRDIYKLTRGAETAKMKDAVGYDIEVKAFVIYEDTDAKGNLMTVTSVMGSSGQVYATNSPTFRREFDFITDLLEDDTEPIIIKVVGGTSANQREYVTCTLA